MALPSNLHSKIQISPVILISLVEVNQANISLVVLDLFIGFQIFHFCEKF